MALVPIFSRISLFLISEVFVLGGGGTSWRNGGKVLCKAARNAIWWAIPEIREKGSCSYETYDLFIWMIKCADFDLNASMSLF